MWSPVDVFFLPSLSRNFAFKPSECKRNSHSSGGTPIIGSVSNFIDANTPKTEFKQPIWYQQVWNGEGGMAPFNNFFIIQKKQIQFKSINSNREIMLGNTEDVKNSEYFKVF